MQDHLLFAMLALLCNAAFAGPRRLFLACGTAHVSQLPAHLLRTLERKLNREHRSDKQREIRGIILAALVAVGATIFGYMLSWMLAGNLQFVELLILAACLPVRECIDIALGVRKHLLAGNIVKARQVLEGTPWRHHALLDEFGVARAAIENVAIQLCCKILAPLFWYLLLGLPGLFMSKLVYMLQETLALAPAQPKSFAKASISLSQFMHVIPVQIGAYLCLMAGAFLPSGKWRQAGVFLLGHWGAPLHVLSLAGVASVLGLSLGGPSSVYVSSQWIDAGTVRASGGDVLRAVYLFGLALLLLLVLLGALA